MKLLLVSSGDGSATSEGEAYSSAMQAEQQAETYEHYAYMHVLVSVVSTPAAGSEMQARGLLPCSEATKCASPSWWLENYQWRQRL